MKSLYFLLGLTLSLSSFATNSYCNLNFDYTNTGSNMTIFFTQDAVSNLNLEGTIGAFYINDNGDYNCGAAGLQNTRARDFITRSCQIYLRCLRMHCSGVTAREPRTSLYALFPYVESQQYTQASCASTQGHCEASNVSGQ